MFKNFTFFTKYPYTAGIIACVWIGSAILTTIDPKLPLVEIATINVIFSAVVAAIGFRGSN